MSDASQVWGPVPDSPPGWSWESLMGRVLELARSNIEASEIPVGAIVVSADGIIVGEGVNAPIRTNDPSAHAEVQALRAAGERLGNYRLNGCTLVVTLEPCLMCTGAVVHARLAGVVYGAPDEKAGAISSGLHGLELALHEHRPWHLGGVRASECAALLKDFFKQRR